MPFSFWPLHPQGPLDQRSATGARRAGGGAATRLRPTTRGCSEWQRERRAITRRARDLLLPPTYVDYDYFLRCSKLFNCSDPVNPSPWGFGYPKEGPVTKRFCRRLAVVPSVYNFYLRDELKFHFRCVL